MSWLQISAEEGQPPIQTGAIGCGDEAPNRGRNPEDVLSPARRRQEAGEGWDGAQTSAGDGVAVRDGIGDCLDRQGRVASCRSARGTATVSKREKRLGSQGRGRARETS